MHEYLAFAGMSLVIRIRETLEAESQSMNKLAVITRLFLQSCRAAMEFYLR